jgi:hypothetical protein
MAMIFERVLEEDIFSVLPYGAPFLSGAEITKARRSTEGAGRQSDCVWVREAGRSDPESRRGRMALALRKTRPTAADLTRVRVAPISCAMLGESARRPHDNA